MPTDTIEQDAPVTDAAVTTETPKAPEPTADDLLFDRVMGNKPADSDFSRNDKGQFAPKADKTPEASPDPAKDAKDDDGGTDAAAGETKPFVKVAELSDQAKGYAKAVGVETDEAAFDAALKAYKNDGIFTDEELEERYAKNAKAFIENGLKRAKVQHDGNELYKNYRELRDRDGAGKTSDAAAKDESQKDTLPLPEAVKAELAKLTESIPLQDEDGSDNFLTGQGAREIIGKLGTTLATTISSHYQTVIDKLSKVYSEKIEAVTGENQWLEGMLVDERIEQTRKGLLEKYPDLEKDDVHKKVLAAYDELSNANKYDNLEKVGKGYRLAVLNTLGEESENNLRARMLKRSSAAREMATSAPTHANGHSRPSLKDDDVFDRIATKHRL